MMEKIFLGSHVSFFFLLLSCRSLLDGDGGAQATERISATARPIAAATGYALDHHCTVLLLSLYVHNVSALLY